MKRPDQYLINECGPDVVEYISWLEGKQDASKKRYISVVNDYANKVRQLDGDQVRQLIDFSQRKVDEMLAESQKRRAKELE